MSSLTVREARLRRHRRVRGKITGTAERPRLIVFRSNRGIFAQLDRRRHGQDARVRQLARPRATRATRPSQASEVGKALAAAAKKAGIETVVFDRAGYLYHGRVKALAEGAREGGLNF